MLCIELVNSKMNIFIFTLKNSHRCIMQMLNKITRSPSPRFPDYSFALDFGAGHLPAQTSPLTALKNIIDEGFLWAVPKARRSLERRMTRRMGFGKMLLPQKNLVVCDACGHFHPVHTLCGNCYEKVKKETEIMQDAIMKELKLEPIDKEVVVLYENDAKEKIFEGKRIIELQKERPHWFSKNLLAKDSELLRKKSKSVNASPFSPKVDNVE
ncbi:39S ribosomal protein L32, mitochondrial-like [Uloborus diversus]|uniref:39S ribosomal protein L32, mitochondrial-like n=1 Tax=Uloborus diversus TaxID=327109 RepID=UPI00240A94DB|nr:39S ribosomal protein L32, mitochondrial-like [Uloborus diversus]